jgi:hypothetical protein
MVCQVICQLMGTVSVAQKSPFDRANLLLYVRQTRDLRFELLPMLM